ncbi:hypothetical protein LDL36_16820 [Komagataeibacter sp. FNDCR1]|nr:hypothetical protein [Komagataeibacter sp. FNDCR1]
MRSSLSAISSIDSAEYGPPLLVVVFFGLFFLMALTAVCMGVYSAFVASPDALSFAVSDDMNILQSFGKEF